MYFVFMARFSRARTDLLSLGGAQAQLDRAMTALRKVYARAAEEVTNNRCGIGSVVEGGDSESILSSYVGTSAGLLLTWSTWSHASCRDSRACLSFDSCTTLLPLLRRRLIHNLQCDLHAAQAELYWVKSSTTSGPRSTAAGSRSPSAYTASASTVSPAPPLLPPPPLPPPPTASSPYGGHGVGGIGTQSASSTQRTSIDRHGDAEGVGARGLVPSQPTQCERGEQHRQDTRGHDGEKQQTGDKPHCHLADGTPARPSGMSAPSVAHPASLASCTGTRSSAPGGNASLTGRRDLVDGIPCARCGSPTSGKGTDSNDKCQRCAGFDGRDNKSHGDETKTSAPAGFQGNSCSPPQSASNSDPSNRPRSSPTGKAEDVAGLDLIMAASYKMSELEEEREKVCAADCPFLGRAYTSWHGTELDLLVSLVRMGP